MPLPPAAIFPNLVLIVDDVGVVVARLAPTLAAEDILQTILAREDCWRHWQFILETIPEGVSPELKKQLQTAAWLPGPEGKGVAPSCIVSRDGLKEYVRHLHVAGRRR